MTPKSLLSALEDLELSLLTSDWSLLGHGDDWVEIRGWRALAPERYALLCATALCVGYLYGAWLLLGAGGAGGVWLSRRFRLRVSAHDELECQMSVCGVTYRALRLPLWARLYCEGEGGVRLIRLGGDAALFEPLELLSCARPRAVVLCELINSTAQQAQRLRLEDPERFTRAAQPRLEPGEWLVTLIEGAPTLLGPTTSRHSGGGRCAWWAPRGGLTLSCALLVTSAPALAAQLSAPLLSALLCWLLALGALVSARESLCVSVDGVTWRRSLLGFVVRERRWPLSVTAHLEVDSVAPSGRRVTLYTPGAPETLASLGAPWDARWIHQTLLELIRGARGAR